MIANYLWIKLPLVKGGQHRCQALGCLLMEKQTGDTLDNGSERATRTVGDNRPTRGLCLQRCNADILFAGEEKCATMCVVVKHLLIGEPPQKADGRPGHFLQACLVATTANDDQRQLKPVTGFNGKVDALIGDQTANDQEILFWLCCRVEREALSLHRRRNHDCLAAVIPGYALSHNRRVGDKMIDAHGAGLIPDAQAGNHKRQNTPCYTPQLLALDILTVIPAPAHRRVTITNMHRLRLRNHSLTEGAGTA